MIITNRDIGRWVKDPVAGIFPAVLSAVKKDSVKLTFADGSGHSRWYSGENYRLATKKEVIAELRSYIRQIQGEKWA